MLDFHEKRRIKSYIYSKPAILLVCLLAVLLAWSTFERYQSAAEMGEKRERLTDELESLKARAAALEAEVTYLKSDRGIEEEIRDRYEVSRSGERVVVIVGEETTSTTAETATETEKSGEESLWRKMWPL